MGGGGVVWSGACGKSEGGGDFELGLQRKQRAVERLQVREAQLKGSEGRDPWPGQDAW